MEKKGKDGKERMERKGWEGEDGKERMERN